MRPGGCNIIYRSFAEHMRLEWKPDVAMVVNGEPVTWREVHAARTERQERILGWKRRVEEPAIVPCYVWTFFNSGFLYHGWHCYVVIRNRNSFGDRTEAIAANFRGFNHDLAASIMRAVPIGLGLLPTEDNFYWWMQKFAQRYPRRKPKRDRRRAGSILGWLQDRKTFTLQRPETEEGSRRGAGFAEEERMGHACLRRGGVLSRR